MTLCMAGWRLSSAATSRNSPCCKQQTEQNESAARRLIPHRLLLPSVAEMCAMIAKLLLRSPLRRRFVLASSDWRRRHQINATNAHYQTQQAQL
jgi:hypothetical protein